MKKLLLTLTIVCLMIGMGTYANATLAFYEDFSNAPGSLTTYGVWSTHSGTGGQLQIIGTAADYGFNSLGYVGLTIPNGNRIQIGGGNGEDVHRNFPTQYARPTTLYASFLVKVTTLPTAETYFAHFDDGSGFTLFRGKVFAFGTTGGLVALGISWSANGGTYATPGYSPNTTHLVVEKMTLVADTTVADDTAELWVDPGSLGGVQPASDVAVIGTPATDITGPGLFGYGIRETSATQGTQEVDEVRVGTTWADVTPTTTPLPVELSNFNAVPTSLKH